MDDVITLLQETYTLNSIGVSVATITSREIFCHIESVTRSEFFAAGNIGLNPAFVATTPAVNYDNEKLATYHGKRYAIYRSYQQGEKMYLYFEEQAGKRVESNG